MLASFCGIQYLLYDESDYLKILVNQDTVINVYINVKNKLMKDISFSLVI